MRKSILVICDEEKAYAYHFMDYLGQARIGEGFPFEVQVFTSLEGLEAFCRRKKPEFLLLSQELYERRQDWDTDLLMVLGRDEGGPEGVVWISKYQSAEAIVRAVFEAADRFGLLPPALQLGRRGGMKLIGVYSPVRRCLQTTFSFTLGQLLAQKYRVLYLNFECYSGFSRMMNREFSSDLSDLIYFLHNGDGRFPYRLEGVAVRLNGLDFIPPAFSCVDLQGVQKEEWLALFEALEQSGLYEYVILDLSENIQGLFDILQRCSRVYTIVQEDECGLAKQEQYEELLRCLEYGEILDHTMKFRLPEISSLPKGLEDMTHGELAALVGGLIEEEKL